MEAANSNTNKQEVFVILKLRTGEVDLGSSKLILDVLGETVPTILKFLELYKETSKDIKLL